MKQNASKLSIVIPTLNCAGMIGEHLESMRPWLYHLAHEVIVVDSHSEDGTAQMIQQHLQHPRLKILTHPRGLYQSWNHAISKTSGDWVYISTVGDSIKRSQLEDMLLSGTALGSDVVSSMPSFIFEDGRGTKPQDWPINSIIKDYQISTPAQISSLAAFYYALECFPNAILGSSASNIYRGDHLRARPFPTEYSVMGDAAWAIKYAFETRFCYTGHIGSTFRLHAKVYSLPNHEETSRLRYSLIALAKETYAASSISPDLRPLFDFLFCYIHTLEEAQSRYRMLRKSGILPWYFKASAWRARTMRNNLLRQRKDHTLLRSLMLQEPVRVLESHK